MFVENKFSKIGPIYYEYGSMVITYEDSEKAVRALYILRESKYEDKQPLLGKHIRNKQTQHLRINRNWTLIINVPIFILFQLCSYQT